MEAMNLKGFAQWVGEHQALASDPLWTRPLGELSEVDMIAYYARNRFNHDNAVKAIDTLQTELVIAAMEGAVTTAEMWIVGHDLPPTRFTADDYIDGLLKLSQPRRAAVHFAMVTRMEPHLVAELTWKEVTQFLRPDELEVLQARASVRHIKLPYVFWEWATDRIAAPLIRLREDAEAAFGMPWPRIQLNYSSMLAISTYADSQHLLGIVEEIAQGEL